MIVLFYILLLLAAFILMEAVTWLSHRYIMHGFLWYLHKDHHRPPPGFFEKNDYFFILFAVPTISLLWYSTYHHLWWLQAIGFGIMAYGFCYFIVHDVIIHQRFKWFSRSRNTYVRALRWAHKMHHKQLDKHHGESFGMLYVHKKYWQKVRRELPRTAAGNVPDLLEND
jgi:beta-carotene 3-hydroxylase